MEFLAIKDDDDPLYAGISCGAAKIALFAWPKEENQLRLMFNDPRLSFALKDGPPEKAKFAGSLADVVAAVDFVVDRWADAKVFGNAI